MPMLPELDSTTTVPRRIRPCSIPCLMMFRAGRSFVLPPGLRDSSLAYNRKGISPNTRCNLTRGVLPMAERILSFIFQPLKKGTPTAPESDEERTYARSVLPGNAPAMLEVVSELVGLKFPTRRRALKTHA